jgi:hypothetical protein
VTSLGALVADLTGRAERATVGSGTITRDVAELAAGVALHSLSLAVTGEVVGATALVAGSGALVAAEATTEITLETAARATGATASRTSRGTTSGTGVGTGTGNSGAGAVAGKVAGLAAVVAAAVGAVQTEGGTVSLDVTEALAVVALLGLGGTGKRAGARLVAGLLAVVAETLSWSADLGIVANSATLVARATRQHHCGRFLLKDSSERKLFNSHFSTTSQQPSDISIW